MNAAEPLAASKPEKADAIVLTGFSLVSIAAVCLMATSCGYRQRDQSATAPPALAETRLPANGGKEGPEIEQNWKELDRIAHEHLDGYGWVDRAAGVVHIPIDRAMDLVVAEKKSSGPAVGQTNTADFRTTDTTLQRTGRQVLLRYGCTVCHDPDAVNHAPSLVGIYGQRVRLNDGTFVRVDDRYLHDSIMLSSKQVVAGYAPAMPGYSTMIPEPDVRELIAYLKSYPGTASTPKTPPTH
jgi:mono/diheme cytochrome c family protein